MSPDLDKAALRVRLRALRKALAAADPHAAVRAADRLPTERLPVFAAFSGYRACGSEIDPQPLMDRLLETGAAACLPVSDRDGPLTFRAWRPGDPLSPDAFGAPAPLADAPRVHPDLLIVPLLGFDRFGGRLGQGGGHYDRTLASLRRHGRIFVLGLAYAGQEVAALQLEDHDQRLDAILTETAYIEVG